MHLTAKHNTHAEGSSHKPFARMKNQCQNGADAVLEVDPQHFHPRRKSKHLSCQIWIS